MRKALLLVLALFTMALSYEVSAQQRVITGKVISEEDGLGLPGASILVKGTTVGTTTDLDGNYSINVPAGSNVLIYSFIGLKTKEEAIGNRSVINVTLNIDAAQLSEVVVTAIGIEREKKALGYAVSSVGEEQISNRPEADVSRVLQGKVAGVNITATNGMSGSGTNIIIRGYSSATGSNQPLFIVDGVPFSTGTNAANGFSTGGATTSSRFLDIDPNNIESVNVLKGLSATVLYGDQGRNGVILITTKSGAAKRRPAEVTVNQSFFTNKAASLPTFGNIYGNGFQQQPGFFFSNFGPRMDTGLQVNHPVAASGLASIRNAFPEFRNPDGTPILYDYKAYEDISTAFFRTGLVSNTSLQMSGSSDKTGFSASFGYTKDQGFTPGNELQKFNFGLGVNSAITDKLSVNSSFTFAITDLETPPVNAAFGSGASGGIPSVFANVLYTPRSVDIANLPFENPVDRSSVYYRSGNDQTNPLWLAKYYRNTSLVNRFFNSTSLNYDVNDNFSVTYRIGLDTYTEQRDNMYNKGGGTGSSVLVNSGYFRSLSIRNTIWNQDLVINFKKDLSEKIGFSALIGGNSRYDSYAQDGIVSTGQLAFDLFRHTNFLTSASRDPFNGAALNFTQEERRMGVYAAVTLDYNDYLFLNLSARNDWTSTVEKENRRILYPGASVSFLPSQAFNWNSSTVNDLKLRFGYGTSAGFPSPYRTRNILEQNAQSFERGGSVFQSQSVSRRLGNPNLKPELHEEFEFGVESAMFNNKLRLDLSVYQKNTKDLITGAPIDPATGYTLTEINIGKIRNRGVELQATATPVSTASGFSWESIVNFGLYRTIVMELGGGLEEVVVSGFTDLGNFAIPGKPFNIIKGTGFARDEQTGQPIVLPNGDYQTAAELVELGDPNPAWTGSWINTFRYKGLSLNVMMEYRHKGTIFSNTVTASLARGVTKDPVVDRELTFILPGVKQDGTPNDIQITASNYFFNQYHTGADESNIFDGSTIRLREVSLGYDIPSNLVSKTPFKRASIALSGTNLWFRALNFPPNMNFDTDVLGLGVGNGLGFDFVTGPSSRRFGGTVTLSF
ncbi:membrane protein [Rhodonellum psychrophilum GCM71 = DSM 17998]|uniref:Membrane protein n=2 Tax=Rhodonellum TaxID=336827 RepID=U5BVT5_9BACT|nr:MULTISPECIES: SusC/RagA family TonB-linked outer membrane protein [Rhodonellum]ERM81973.1 membrane protein [Rhodonellum psychrophilum GCM71 = DSM 17998]MDO9553697.1 SusC/RagA family TonB-linked outer membrane protein [Rhodonellum sp.]SDY69566.1 TonB-linked outer membrane protein, SusC/RagA family [Rhodonellum ikkaensis]